MANHNPPTNGFKKGNRANPGGRPKDVGHVRELAQKHTPEAIAALVRWATDEKHPNAAVAAANHLLNRAWGMPSQMIEGNTLSPLVLSLKQVIEENDGKTRGVK